MTQSPTGDDNGLETQPPSGHADSTEPQELNSQQLTQSDSEEDQKWAIPMKARRYIWAGGALIALYFIADGVIGILNAENAEPAPAVTVTAEAAAATTQPVSKGETSEFGASIPETDQQFVLTSFEEASDWPVQGPLESFALEYSGKSGEADVVFEVYAAQFSDAEKAKSVYSERLTEGATEIGKGEVSVGENSVGSFVISTDETGGLFPPVKGEDPLPAGTARALWTNGTALFEAFGPAHEIVNFYNGYAF